MTDWFRVFQTYDTLRARVENLDELTASVRASRDPWLEFWASLMERNALVESGDVEGGQRVGARIIALAERVGEPTMRWIAIYSARGCTAMLFGDLAELERRAEQALQVGSQAGEPDTLMMYGAQFVPLRILQGRAAEILPVIGSVLEANPTMTPFRAAQALALCQVGRHQEAAGIVAASAALRFDDLPSEQTRSAGLVLWADVAAQAGVTEAAEILYDLLEPCADQIVFNGVNTFGSIRMYLGFLGASLGRFEEADAHFAAAVESQERLGMLVWLARAQLGWAESFASRGDHGRAREHAGRALELSRSHGYGAFEARAAALSA